jgi:hypothetical protein
MLDGLQLTEVISNLSVIERDGLSGQCCSRYGHLSRLREQ